MGAGRLVRTISALPLALSGAGAAAQRAPPPPANPNEVVVTGERLKRSVKDTPSSVGVYRRDDIEQRAAIDRLDQLLAATPNVQLGSGGEAPSVRGLDGTGVLRDLPAFLGGARPRTTLRVDGRDVGYNEFTYGAASLWDVQRVEIFRSPQTTTQGRNSIGGAIFIETGDPTMGWEDAARAVVGDARTRQLSALVSGPLIDDQLAVRVSGDLRRSRTSSRLSGPIEGVDLNRDDYGQVRVKLLAKPAALPGAELLLTFAHSESNAPQVEGIRPPYRERRDGDVTYGYFTTNVDSLTGLLTTRVSQALVSRTTISIGRSAVRRFAPAGFGETRIGGRDRSLESIVEWKPSAAFRGVGGVHLLSIDLDQTIDLTRAGLGIGRFDDRQKALGLFAEAELRPLAQLTVTAGLRYQLDHQARAGALAAPAGPIPLDYRKRFTAWLPKVSAAYDVSPQLRIGLLAQRATNPGGVTLEFRTPGPDTFDSERLWDYELFGRARLFGNKLSIDANLFVNRIRDAQRPQLGQLVTPAGTVFFSEVDNAPEARSRGAEIEARWIASPRVSLGAGLGLLSTRITRTRLPNDPLLGKAFARAPARSFNASIDWRPLPHFRLSSQLRHHSAYFSEDTDDPTRRIGPATIIDLRAGWERNRFRLFGYARNVLDSFRLTYRFATAANGTGLATAGDGREVGVGLETNF